MRLPKYQHPGKRGENYAVDVSGQMALQRAAMERAGIVARPRERTLSGYGNMEYSGKPEGLKAFGQAAGKQMWERATVEVDPRTKMRMWRSDLEGRGR
jgi:hypothetical protein